MQEFTGTTLGKLVRLSTKAKGSGGHALPGLVVEKVFPSYLAKMLNKLPRGVVAITGTNGKTTTTKIVVELLRSQGLKVLTNPTGSNMTRGIASGVIRQAKISGKLDYDIAVFELDEASITSFISQVKPRYVLALNVSRDQLDRYGEVDKIAQLIGQAVEAATEGVVTNADDPNLTKVAKLAGAKVGYFGVASKLQKFFPSDFELAAVSAVNGQENTPRRALLVELADFSGQKVSFNIGGKSYSADFQLTGQHNFQNAAAAIALAKQLLPSVSSSELVDRAAGVSIAFGRGETYKLASGAEVELVLVKNPASFRQALASYASGSEELAIAINDRVADGRDTSWLWDVDLSPLTGRVVNITAGIRAADMALRLSYDQVETDYIEADLDKALSKIAGSPGRKVILATYTAMLKLHADLTKLAGKKS